MPEQIAPSSRADLDEVQRRLTHSAARWDAVDRADVRFLLSLFEPTGLDEPRGRSALERLRLQHPAVWATVTPGRS